MSAFQIACPVCGDLYTAGAVGSTAFPPHECSVKRDRDALGLIVADLYLEALNGVVCAPDHDHGRSCQTCLRRWERAKAILDRLDPEWGNGFRGGPPFQPKEPMVT